MELSTLTKQPTSSILLLAPKWRNWQTRTTQNRVGYALVGSIPTFGTTPWGGLPAQQAGNRSYRWRAGLDVGRPVFHCGDLDALRASHDHPGPGTWCRTRTSDRLDCADQHYQDGPRGPCARVAIGLDLDDGRIV